MRPLTRHFFTTFSILPTGLLERCRITGKGGII